MPDRFDAYLVGIGFDTLVLAVGRPPRPPVSHGDCRRAHGLLPDIVWQGLGSITEYAPILVDAPRWEFWWD